MLVRPSVVAHADWGADSRKQWLAQAVLDEDGVYRVERPVPAGNPHSLLARLFRARPDQSSVLAGFDFPIGVPTMYASRAGIDDFVEALAGFGTGDWRDFYRVAERADEISLRRPFYPQRPGGTSQAQLTAALGVDSMKALLRLSDGATGDRRAACSIFWTLGGNQVGKGAISGWRDVLAPAIKARDPAIAIWPFSGKLDELLETPQVVVVETYPAEFYGHLGIALRGSKRRQDSRQAVAPAFEAWLEQSGVAGRVRFEPGALHTISSGFGALQDGEDRFDAFVGLIGMLNIVLGLRPAWEPPVGTRQRAVEGWIFGQRQPS